MNSDIEEKTEDKVEDKMVAKTKIVFVNGRARRVSTEEEVATAPPIALNRKDRRALTRQLAGRKGDRKSLYKAIMADEKTRIQNYKVAVAESEAYEMDEALTGAE